MTQPVNPDFSFMLKQTCTIQRKGVAVTGATNASPIVITAAAHGYSNGDRVFIEGVTGNTAANTENAGVADNWLVASATTNTFALTGSTGDGAYVSGGTVIEIDGGGQQVVPTWHTIVTGEACLLEVIERRDRQLKTEQIGATVDANMMLGPMADIAQGDRITNVLNPDTTVFDPGPFTPQLVNRQPWLLTGTVTHTEVELERIRERGGK